MSPWSPEHLSWAAMLGRSGAWPLEREHWRRTMAWADTYIEQLKRGELARCRPRGNSMVPIIASGQLVTIDPGLEPEPGNAVLCRCNGNQYVHLVKAIQGHGEQRRFLIGNNRGGINGWVSREAVFGVVTEVGE